MRENFRDNPKLKVRQKNLKTPKNKMNKHEQKYQTTKKTHVGTVWGVGRRAAEIKPKRKILGNIILLASLLYLIYGL